MVGGGEGFSLGACPAPPPGSRPPRGGTPPPPRRRTPPPTLSDFPAELGSSLDPFQVEACEALDEGSGVLVCAPTGAGKTVVGEFAVHKALAEGRKALDRKSTR